MLQNAYFLAKIGADTAENEQHFAEILQTDAEDEASTVPRGRDGPREGGLGVRGRLLDDLADHEGLPRPAPEAGGSARA